MNTTVHGILCVVNFQTEFRIEEYLGETLAEGTVYDFYHEDSGEEVDFQDLGDKEVYDVAIEGSTLVIRV